MGGIALAALLLGAGGAGGGLSVSVTPPTSSGSGTSPTLGHVGSVTAIVSGGSGAISYAWTTIGGDPVIINSPSAATTDFDYSLPDASTHLSTDVRVTVTRGAETAHFDVTLSYIDRRRS